MMNFLVKRQEGIWQRIFNMNSQWKINEEQVRALMAEHEGKHARPSMVLSSGEYTPRINTKADIQTVDKFQ